MTSYFVESVLTANHCGCQILEEQRFSSKHALDAKYKSGFYFHKLFSFYYVLFHSAQFSHQSRPVSCVYFFFYYKTRELLSCWKCSFLCSLLVTWRRVYCFFKHFFKAGLKNVKLQRLDDWFLAGVDFAWCIQALCKV